MCEQSQMQCSRSGVHRNAMLGPAELSETPFESIDARAEDKRICVDDCADRIHQLVFYRGVLRA
jgi:hypothetical protein